MYFWLWLQIHLRRFMTGFVVQGHIYKNSLGVRVRDCTSLLKVPNKWWLYIYIYIKLTNILNIIVDFNGW